MANTSPETIARRVLDACLAGEAWASADIDALVDSDSDTLFGIVAEGLSDRFDPSLCDSYVDIFCHAIARVDERSSADQLRARYRRVRTVRPYRGPRTPKQRILDVEAKALRSLRTGGAAYRVPGIELRKRDPGDPGRIVLLSRITLGADIAVTSVVAKALQARFPDSELLLAGGAKSAELLGLPLLPIAYPRSGGLRSRLRAVQPIAELGEDTLVVDPDSRLTQLGLYAVAPEHRYYFFESRCVEEGGSLPQLARTWCAEVFEVDIGGPSVQAGVAPFEFERPAVAVSLGTGGNEAKRIGAGFERDLLLELGGMFATVIVDKGAGPDEASRVERAAEGIRNVRFWDGSFASFVALMVNCDLYVGYDSAGQHAAAALGIPLVSVFAGAVNDRFFERWRPDGRVIRIDGGSAESAFLRVRSALHAVALRGQIT